MTFLFDIGNVLLKLHFENFHRKVVGHEQAPLPSQLAQLKDPFETGAITDEEFVTRSVELLGDQITPEAFTEAWLNIFSLNDPMWEVVQKLHHDGHRLILFSNTNGLHTRHFLGKYSGFSLFNHHHFSQEVGAIKPHLSC
jgi:FMN phosphatase YigB (HAD superfamily)